VRPVPSSSSCCWWLFTELIGLRRIFEVPWFGVGEDVENVGVVESIVRAGLFVVVVWIALGLSALAFIGMSGSKFVGGGTKTSGATPQSSSTELAPVIAAADKLTGEVKGIRDQLAGRPQPASTDPGTVPQLQRLGDGLRDIRAVLTDQDRKLDALRQIDGRLTRWEQDGNDAAILDEAKRLSGTLGEVRTLLDAQGRRLAALDDFERLLRDLDVKQIPAIAAEIGEMTGAVTEVRRLARAQGDVLERVEWLLKRWSPEAAPPNPPPQADETSCLGRSGAVARAVSAPAAPRRYGRTLLVFFDKSGSQLTPRAGESLRELADELRRVDQPSVTIFGSADAQGDPTLSAQYAEQRAQVVKQFLERNVPQLSVQLTSARSADEPPSEPYNRVARVEAHGTCR
jgi:outer membrane protein OmpA-like peptidoglycan-associated protein